MSGPTSPHFRIVPVADGVWGAVATDEGFGLCNSGIVDLGDVTVVFDSMLTPQAGADLRAAAERLTGHPVGYLVNSHWHGDHVRGNISFPSVRIVSTRTVRELIETRAVTALESERESVPSELAAIRAPGATLPTRDRTVFEGWFEGILATPKGTVIPAPDLLVEGELVLRGPRREVRVVTFGGGHSPSDVLAYVPDLRVGFLGDLLAIGFHPSVTDGIAAAWVRILDSVRGLPIERILPGHGPLGGLREVGEMQEYLRTLGRLAAAAPRTPEGRRALAATEVPERFGSWTFRPFFLENLLSVYDKLGAGTAPVATGSSAPGGP